MSGAGGPQVPGSPSAQPIAAVLSTIAAQARRTNLVRAAEIRATLERVTDRRAAAEEWLSAQRTAHQLAGSAGTFGYAAASELARSLEQQLNRLAGLDAAELDHAHIVTAHRLLDELTAQLSGEPNLD